MKRKLCLTIALAVTAVAAIGLAACGDETDTHTEHQWDGGTQLSAPSCTETGRMLYTCEICNETKTEEIPMTDHVLEYEHEGEQHWRKCVNCTYEEAREDCVWEIVSEQAADCLNDGSIDYACVCGNEKHETIEAVGSHNYQTLVEIKTPATCVTEGVGVYRCTECGETAELAIAATGQHNFEIFVEYAKEPTCGQAGSAVYKCRDCDETEEREVAATGEHTLVWNYEDGEHWQECEVCGYIGERTPHGDEDWTVNERTEADCLTEGSVEYVCVCGAVKTETIPATGHSFETLVETISPATCGAEGLGLYECVHCGEREELAIPATGEHQYETVHDGEQHYLQCSVCGGIDENSYEDHDFGDGYTIEEEATYYASGVRYKSCACGYTVYEAYELEGYVTDYGKGVTGEESGWTFGRADVKWGDTSGNYVPMGGDSFDYIQGAQNENGDAYVTDGVEIKNGWIGGRWSVLQYTVSEGADYTIALMFRHAGGDESPNVRAIVRVQVVSVDGTAKQYEFYSLNGSGDGTGEVRVLSGLEEGDKIYVIIDFEEGWEQGDITCRLFEAIPAAEDQAEETA